MKVTSCMSVTDVPESLVLTITRYSGLVYNRKGVFRKKKASIKAGIEKYDPTKYKKYDDTIMATGITIYTYIIKDEDEDVFKIGKTKSPITRFKSICRHGKVYPIGLVSKDIEKILHKKYADNRCVNKKYKGNGSTEWFRRGGIFDDFIGALDTGKKIPYITVYTMVEYLVERSIITVENQSLLWEISQADLGYYMIGLQILEMTGYITLIPFPNPTNKGRDHILQIKKRIALSDILIDTIKDDFRFYIAANNDSSLFEEAPGTHPKIKKFSLDNKNTTAALFILKKSVL